MRTFFLSFTAFVMSAAATVNAQSKEAEKYRKESDEIRRNVWAWDKPQFNVREIPKQYANASKVVLAHHTELTADSKSKFQFYVITFGVKKEQTLTEIVREMVKVNDKNAVAYYSELSFTQFQKSSGFFAVEKTTSYVGVRVIKPNGTVKEINADDIVLTKDESALKKAKVAIPDLQPGDILDYFIATQQFMTDDLSTKPYRIVFFDDAPVLDLSFHAQLGKKYTLDYRSYNSAPELLVSKNDDDDIIINVEKKDIPPSETSLWVAPALQLPFIRMNIQLGYKGMGSRMLHTKKPGEINKITDGEAAITDKTNKLSGTYYNNYWFRAARVQFTDIARDAEKKAKQMGISYKDMSEEEKAALLYYTFRFTKLLNFNIDDLAKKIDIGNYIYNDLGLVMYCILKSGDLESSMVLSGGRSGVPFNQAIDADDLTAVAYLAGINKYLDLQYIYDVPFTVPSELEGLTETKNLSFTNKATSVGSNFSAGPVIPASTAAQNAHIESLSVSVTPDKTALAVKRATTLKGFYKTAEQKNLVLYEDFYDAERKAFKEEKSLLQELEDGRKSSKYVDEVKNAFAEARKKQKDAFVKEAAEWFEQDVTNLTNYKTDNLGVRHTAPDFVYSSSFTLNGLVKKAGNNIIVEIGKIQGQPLVVKQEQRKRDLDVYMPYARSIEYNIDLEIPEGYTAEGVAALNKKVENESGFFTAEASATEKLVTIKVKKHYLHNYEPAKNWDKLILFMDASNEWVNAKLLLKKK